MLESNYTLSRKVRWAILLVGVILVILNLFMMDYSEVWSRENLGNGLQILANIFIIAAMVTSLRYTARKGEE